MTFNHPPNEEVKFQAGGNTNSVNKARNLVEFFDTDVVISFVVARVVNTVYLQLSQSLALATVKRASLKSRVWRSERTLFTENEQISYPQLENLPPLNMEAWCKKNWGHV
jgi:hypothetical protein